MSIGYTTGRFDCTTSIDGHYAVQGTNNILAISPWTNNTDSHGTPFDESIFVFASVDGIAVAGRTDYA